MKEQTNEQNPNEQAGEQGISEQDALLTIEILRKALEYRPQIQRAVMGAELLALPEVERRNEWFSPRVAIHYIGDKGNIPSLYFRFIGSEAPIVEAFFYPIEAIASFMAEARSYARWAANPQDSEEVIEKVAFNYAVDMTLIMIDNFYRRAELMMESFPSEVIAQWRIQNWQNVIQYHAERGNIMERKKDKTLENLVGLYAKDVLKLWKYQGQSYANWRKLQFVEEYDAIYKHWRRLSKMLSEDDWREYAKPGKFKDTPDDLLNKLENTDRADADAVDLKLSRLAIEHAGRRVGLIKKHGVDQHVVDQRKEGIKATGYTSAQLFNFLKEGRELKAQIEAAKGNPTQERVPVSVEQKADSGQIKMAKSFVQKFKYVQETLDSTVEQKGDSAQEEKS